MFPDYVLSDYEGKHWTGVQRLFKEVFDKKLDPGYFKWKNEDNPNGKSIIKTTSYDGQVVGYTCVMKYKMSLFGKNIMAGQSVDAMVEKKHQRKGIYENMAMEALRDIKEQGLGIRFNFPNTAAFLASTKKVNIKKVCDMPRFLKVLDGKAAFAMFTDNRILKLFGGSLLNIYNKLRSNTIHSSAEYEIKEIKNFDSGFDELWEKVRNDYPIALVRDSVYLNWRYAECVNDYKIFAAFKDEKPIGYIVGTLEEKIGKDGETLILGHIADIICHGEHTKAAKSLVSILEKYFKNENACAISCWMLKHWFYAGTLKNQGFLQYGSPVILAAIPMTEILKIGKDKIYNQRNWFITMGDSDYI